MSDADEKMGYGPNFWTLEAADDVNVVSAANPGQAAWARPIIVEALKRNGILEPSLGTVQIAQAICGFEGGNGKGWNGKGLVAVPGAPSIADMVAAAKDAHNWGAVQCCKPGGKLSQPPDVPAGVCDPSTSFLYQDTNPKMNPPRYWICFKRYPDDVSGAADMVRIATRTAAEKAAFLAADVRAVSTAMFDAGYYGSPFAERQKAIDYHVSAIMKNVQAIAAALNEPVAVKGTSGGGGGNLTPGDHGGLLLGALALGFGIVARGLVGHAIGTAVAAGGEVHSALEDAGNEAMADAYQIAGGWGQSVGLKIQQATRAPRQSIRIQQPTPSPTAPPGDWGAPPSDDGAPPPEAPSDERSEGYPRGYWTTDVAGAWGAPRQTFDAGAQDVAGLIVTNDTIQAMLRSTHANMRKADTDFQGAKVSKASLDGWNNFYAQWRDFYAQNLDSYCFLGCGTLGDRIDQYNKDLGAWIDVLNKEKPGTWVGPKPSENPPVLPDLPDGLTTFGGGAALGVAAVIAALLVARRLQTMTESQESLPPDGGEIDETETTPVGKINLRKKFADTPGFIEQLGYLADAVVLGADALREQAKRLAKIETKLDKHVEVSARRHAHVMDGISLLSSQQAKTTLDNAAAQSLLYKRTADAQKAADSITAVRGKLDTLGEDVRGIQKAHKGWLAMGTLASKWVYKRLPWIIGVIVSAIAGAFARHHWLSFRVVRIAHYADCRTAGASRRTGEKKGLPS